VDPDLGGALATYRRTADHLLEDALGAQPPRITLDSVRLSSDKPANGRAELRLTEAAGTFAYRDAAGRFDFDGRCLDWTDSSGTDTTCLEEVLPHYRVDGLQGFVGGAARLREIRLIAVADGDGWRISPLATAASYLEEFVSAATESTALRSLQLVHHHAPAASVSPGGTATAAVNDAGFTVIELRDVQPGRVFAVRWNADRARDYGQLDVVDAHGRSLPADYSASQARLFRAEGSGPYFIVVQFWTDRDGQAADKVRVEVSS
jgi:hypothetical protein